MHWQSLADFFAMGGYALYVWGSFAACLAVCVIEPWRAKQRHCAIMARLIRLYAAAPDSPPAVANLAKPQP